MPLKNRNNTDFGDILAAFDRDLSEGTTAALHRPRPRVPHVDPEAAGEPAEPPRPKNRMRQLLGNISLHWPTGISGHMGGFWPRPAAPYAEEASEAKNASPVELSLREAPKTETVKTASAKTEIEKSEPAKTEDQAIAEELGLSPDLATIDLQRIRRDFAKKNHPDRFEPGRRTNAARRMSIANMLIDEQMRQSRPLNKLV